MNVHKELLSFSTQCTEKSKPRFWSNPTQKPRVKNIFLQHILRPIQNLVSSLPDHFCIGVKMTSKNIFVTLRFWVELPQMLGFGFSVYGAHAHSLGGAVGAHAQQGSVRLHVQRGLRRHQPAVQSHACNNVNTRSTHCRCREGKSSVIKLQLFLHYVSLRFSGSRKQGGKGGGGEEPLLSRKCAWEPSFDGRLMALRSYFLEVLSNE